MKKTKRGLLGVALLLAGAGMGTAAENPAAAASNPDAVFEGSATTIENWGGASRTYVTYPAWSIQPIDSTFTYAFSNNVNGGQGINRTGGPPWGKLPINIPSGALLEVIEFNYCDTGPGALTFFLVRQAKNGASAFTTVHTSAGTPGCIVQLSTLATPVTIDNNANSYNMEISFGSADNTLLVGSVRFGYRLQVSPAPATASFSDVPVGDPIHRFVEALAAAGITGGCGGGQFCPNSPLTRGQMAVFLAAALGLHFPN